jgi:hypothetical protein
MNRAVLVFRWACDQLYGLWISFFPPKDSDAPQEKTPPENESSRTEP